MYGLVQPVSHSGASPVDCSILNLREFKAPPPFGLSPSLISIFSHPRIPPHALLCSVRHHSFFSSTVSSSSTEFPLLIVNSCLKALLRPLHPRDGSLKRSQCQSCFHLSESRGSSELQNGLFVLLCSDAASLSDVSTSQRSQDQSPVQQSSLGMKVRHQSRENEFQTTCLTGVSRPLPQFPPLAQLNQSFVFSLLV